MKKFISFMVATFFCQLSFAQINTGSIKPVSVKTVKIIPAVKASLIRKDLVNLKLQLTQLNDSVGITKKAIDEEVKKMADNLDAMSEMGEMESLRLQMAMDRLSKMMSTLSNLLKKINDTAQGITQNIK
jgi:predicted  nucleic acid-binding Zn-ribbon protein